MTLSPGTRIGHSEGPINYYLNEHLLKMFIGVYLIMTHDPWILSVDSL